MRSVLLQAAQTGSTAAAVEATSATAATATTAPEPPAAAAAQQPDSRPAKPASRQRNVRVEYEKVAAEFQQLAVSDADSMAAAIPLLLEGCKHLRQLTARTALDAATGSLHPASQVEPLTQLDPGAGFSLKRHEALCLGGRGNGKRRKQQQPPAAQQLSTAAIEPFAKPVRKASGKRAPLISRLPGYQPKGQENAGGSLAAKATASAAQQSFATRPLAPAAGLQQQLPAMAADRIPALGTHGTDPPAARTLLPHVSPAHPAAAAGPTLQLVPSQGYAAAPSVLPLPSAIPRLPENLPPAGAPAAGWPNTAAIGLQQPVPGFMQFMANLLAQQQAQQLANSRPS